MIWNTFDPPIWVKEAYKSSVLIRGNIQILKYVLPLDSVILPYDPGEYLKANPDQKWAQEEPQKKQRQNFRHQQWDAADNWNGMSVTQVTSQEYYLSHVVPIFFFLYINNLLHGARGQTVVATS